ncbi:MAG: Crp/Fnr family transcriptional regulator [Deferribacteraceae bacterium]|jgi:CRP-like cAMP-binding protein|nr:Crp/Fnr family transcriptional regulator [Deferribacteraceae bacterium]
MRQVFVHNPYVYSSEPPEIKNVYFRYGVFERLKRGTPVIHGGAHGRFYFLKKGLGACIFTDKNGRSHIFTLVLPGQAFGDIDGITRETVNCTDMVIRPSEVLSIDYETWYKHIGSRAEILLISAKSIINRHDAMMEQMIANYTLRIPERIKVLLKALITTEFNDYRIGWNKVPFNLSNVEYAALVGATRVSISRLFTEWSFEGLLKKNNRELFVHTDLLADVYDWMIAD